MTNHSLINASGRTHVKIAFLALAVSAVFVAAISAGIAKPEAAGTRVAVVKASTIMKVAVTDRSVVR